MYLVVGDRSAYYFVEVLESEAEPPAGQCVCRPKEASAALGPQSDEDRVYDDVRGDVA